MTNFVRNFFRDEAGAAAAEYALILAIVGAGIAGGAYYLGDKINDAMRATGDKVTECSADGENC